MTSLSKEELTLASKNNIKLYQDLLIFHAQPAITKDLIDKIEEHLIGSIPPELLDLWSVSFGGALFYQCRLKFEGYHTSGSFEELFYPKSDHYGDLWTWINLEVEGFIANHKALGKEWSGKLDILPFAGFQYNERFYLVVDPEADDYGAVLCWREAFNAFPGSILAQDALAKVAPDLTTFLSQLTVECEPRSKEDRYAPSEYTLYYLDKLKKKGSKEAALADKLEALYSSKLVPWRKALANGTITNENYMLVIALERATSNNDITLLKQLDALGCDLNTPLHGNFSALTYALNAGCYDAARYLLSKNVDQKDAPYYLDKSTPDDIQNAIHAAPSD